MKYATVAFGVFSLFLVVVSGAYTLWSNVVQEDVTEFGLTLTSSSNGIGVTLSGTLTDDGGSPVIGATVSLYEVDNLAGDNPSLITTTTTDGSGDYTYWFLTTTGTHYYRARYDVP